VVDLLLSAAPVSNVNYSQVSSEVMLRDVTEDFPQANEDLLSHTVIPGHIPALTCVLLIYHIYSLYDSSLCSIFT